jgi:hypothetical protein
MKRSVFALGVVGFLIGFLGTGCAHVPMPKAEPSAEAAVAPPVDGRSPASALTGSQRRVERGKLEVFSDGSGYLTFDGLPASLIYERLTGAPQADGRVEYKVGENVFCRRVRSPEEFRCMIPIANASTGAVGKGSDFSELDQKHRDMLLSQ